MIKETMEDKIDKLTTSIDKLIFYMYSDPATNRKGLVEELTILKSTVDDIIVRDKIMKAKASVWGAVGAVIITVIWKLVGLLIPSIR